MCLTEKWKWWWCKKYLHILTISSYLLDHCLISEVSEMKIPEKKDTTIWMWCYSHLRIVNIILHRKTIKWYIYFCFECKNGIWNAVAFRFKLTSKDEWINVCNSQFLHSSRNVFVVFSILSRAKHETQRFGLMENMPVTHSFGTMFIQCFVSDTQDNIW